MEGRTAFIGAERRDPLLEYYSWRLASFSLLFSRIVFIMATICAAPTIVWLLYNGPSFLLAKSSVLKTDI